MTRQAIRDHYLTDETSLVGRLAEAAGLNPAARTRVSERAANLVREVRETGKVGIMEQFLAEYGLSTEEGVALMCLAEAMLRVPDSFTVNELIRDKITPHDWAEHIGDSGSILVNASTWGLMLTGRVLDDDDEDGIVATLRGLVRRLGEPVIRTAVGQAMAEMGAQFVLGRSIEEAMERGQEMVARGYAYSYDMLGEAARTEKDALRYHQAYARAIAAIAKTADKGDVRANPGISVKLSAIHPRYERAQLEAMLPVMVERLLELARAAKSAGIGLNIDAEEADRLDISLDVIERTLADPSLAGWDGFGIVVQAYGRRALPTLDWLHGLAERLDRRIMVRLVKGAYWDMEIKRAQTMGLESYPVFTRKAHTDISYLAGAAKLLGMTDRIYPQFATHNAHSVAAVLEMAGNDRESFEFQRLHGMGEALHETVLNREGTRCRIYAPVGVHSDLLAYLVRRLLENGANSSFVNQIVDVDTPAEEIARDPIETADAWAFSPNPSIPAPSDLYAPRRNAAGWDLTDPGDLAEIEAGRAPFAAPYDWKAGPITSAAVGGLARTVFNPAKPDEVVGEVVEADPASAASAVGAAAGAQPAWAALPAVERAQILRRVAEIYETNTFEILALATREAGKTLLDGVAEIREAVDFLRFYASEAERLGEGPSARGVIVCISPWNFPLAIFTGQIAAALAAGNAVIAKPAEQTPLIAARAVEWMLAAGVPAGVIQLLPGDGAVGAALTADPGIASVCFTGSTEVAKFIDLQLSESAPGAMLIAETGGMNAMIVDSTALMEQATRDIVRAAFQSAGQRCSALRVLYVQEDVEDKLMEMLDGAMDALVTGDPWELATDVGPVIDAEAHGDITNYVEGRGDAARKRLPTPDVGLFAPPALIRVAGIDEVEREVFGPVLHVATFEGEDIENVVDAVNAKGFGLTFGLHTRIDRRVQRVVDRIHVGNVYVNRDQIGAIVGSQPFGGHGLSGTGPKAGGPNYLPRFFSEPPPPEVAPVRARAASNAAIASAIGRLEGKASARDWAMATDRIARLRTALRGRAARAVAATAALDLGPVDLPGPTGESNQLSLTPRGLVLCLGPTGDMILAQAVQALGVGNGVLAVAPGARAALRPLRRAGLPIVAVDGVLDAEALAGLEVDGVAIHTPLEAIVSHRRVLAQRQGPILPLIRTLIDPVAYCHERAICIDTTAAGGNASLLANAED